MSNVWQELCDDFAEQDRKRGWRRGDPYIHYLFLEAKDKGDDKEIENLLIKYPTYRPARKFFFF